MKISEERSSWQKLKPAINDSCTSSNIDEIVIPILEKIIKLETFFFGKIYTKRTQLVISLLPLSCAILTLAYLFLTEQLNEKTKLYFMLIAGLIPPFLTHRDRPFLLLSILSTAAMCLLSLKYYAPHDVSPLDIGVYRFVTAAAFVVGAYMPLPYNEYEIRYHFTDSLLLYPFRKSGIPRKIETFEFLTFLQFYFATAVFHFLFVIYSLFFSEFALTTGDILVMCGICSVFCTLIFSEMVYAQKRTRLRFDPTRDNNKYAETPHHHKRKNVGPLSIVSSSVFLILLQNTGNKKCQLRDYFLKRRTNNSFLSILSIKNIFKLPAINIKPKETVVLVPESYEYDGPCKRVMGVHCFGTSDVSERVETTLYVNPIQEHPIQSHFSKYVEFYNKIDEDKK